jgi:hypothetical protein
MLWPMIGGPSRSVRLVAAAGLLAGALAPDAVRADDAAPDGLHATPSVSWKQGDHRLDVGASVRSRAEGWAAFTNDYEWYTGVRTRVRAQYAFRERFFLAAELQDVRLFGMTSDGTGALANYRNAANGDHYVGGDHLRAVYAEGRLSGSRYLRVGRQDIKLGSDVLEAEPNWRYLKAARLAERLVGTVGWSHAERAYDGVAAAWDVEGVQLYGFAARPTTGVFEVEHAYSHLSDITVGGVTATLRRGTLSEHVEVGVFGLGYGDDRPPGDGGLPDPVEVGTLGAQLLGVFPVGPGSFDALGWGAYQFGEYDDLDHGAGAAIAEIGYQLPGVFAKPWLRGGINCASGDSHPGDADHETFFNMLPTNHLYYGFADQLAFQNLLNPFVQLRLSPHPIFALNLFVHWLALASDDDLRYAGTGAFDRNAFGFPGTPTDGRSRIGTEYDVVATLTPHRTTTVEFGYAHLEGGAMYRTARDRDLDFAYATLELRY